MLMRYFEPCIDSSRKDPSPSDPRVKVAILDTGADLTHPDIVEAMKRGLVHYYDFIQDESTMTDLDGHGTHCTSVLLKLAPNTETYIGRVFRKSKAPSSSLETLIKVKARIPESFRNTE